MERLEYLKQFKPAFKWKGISTKSFSSVEKNFHIFLQRPLLNTFEILVQPILYFLAFGFGLEFWVPEIGGLPYNEYVFFGIIAATAMTSSLYESSHSIYERYLLGRTYLILKTCPLSMTEVLFGEWLWSVFRSLLVCSFLLLVGKSMNVIAVVEFLPILLSCLWLSIIFSSIGLWICAVVDNFSRSFQYASLIAVPVFLFSGVFFPVSKISPGLGKLIEFLPLSLGVEWIRGSKYLDNFGLSVGLSLGYLVLSFLLFNWSSHRIAEKLERKAEEKLS